MRCSKPCDRGFSHPGKHTSSTWKIIFVEPLLPARIATMVDSWIVVGTMPTWLVVSTGAPARNMLVANRVGRVLSQDLECLGEKHRVMETMGLRRDSRTPSASDVRM